MSDATTKAAQSATWRKSCTRCKKKKIASSFAMNKNTQDKLQNQCRQCQKEMAQERKAKLNEFISNLSIPAGTPSPVEIVSLQKYSELTLISPARLQKMCETGEVPAVNLGTQSQNAWRIAVLPVASEPSEEVAESVNEVGDSLQLHTDYEQLATLFKKIDRLEGMGDAFAEAYPATANFNAELGQFFNDIRSIVHAG